MNSYILQSMANIGCGSQDTREIAEIVDGMTEIELDVLDAMHNFGSTCTLTPYGSTTRAKLISKYSDDDLVCLATYVNAYRNVN